jgi:hypothetical protein
MNSLKHHRHPGHSYERMVKFEEWVVKLAVPLAFVAMGAALVFGLLNSTGHVTW